MPRFRIISKLRGVFKAEPEPTDTLNLFYSSEVRTPNSLNAACAAR